MKPTVEPVKEYQWGADDHRTRVDVIRRYNEDKTRKVWDRHAEDLQRRAWRRQLVQDLVVIGLVLAGILGMALHYWFTR